VSTNNALRLKQFSKKISMSAASIWRRSKCDPTFPKPFKIGPNSTAWDSEEIDAWLESCKSNRPIGDADE
jgi:predicted DNA-binding transcriptional regulator AlpA